MSVSAIAIGGIVGAWLNLGGSFEEWGSSRWAGMWGGLSSHFWCLPASLSGSQVCSLIDVLTSNFNTVSGVAVVVENELDCVGIRHYYLSEQMISSQRLELGQFLIAALPSMSTIESISLYLDSISFLSTT